MTPAEKESKADSRRALLRAGLGGAAAVGLAALLTRPPFARAATTLNASKPFVVVSPNGPNDGGDYGPNTPGTSTSGIQEALNFLAGGSGGVLLFCPGVYKCSSGISINVPAAGNIDYIIQGAGPNATRIVAPYVTNALTGWQQGAYAGRVAIRDIDFELSNSSPPNGILANFGYISLFQRNTLWRFSAGSSPVTCLYCGGPAGPSQPVTWENVQVFASAGAGGTAVWQWYEGFKWTGGLIDQVTSGGQFTGIYCGGESTLEQIDTADGPFQYVIQQNSGGLTIIDFEFPPAGQVYQHIGSGGGSTVILNALTAEANSPFTGALKYMHFQAGPATFKAYGLSMGLLPQPFAIPPSGQAIIGITGNGADGSQVASGPTAGVDYRANADLVVTVIDGTDVSISLLDDSSNVIDSGLTSLSRERLAIGEHMRFDVFTVAPTVNVWHL